MSVELVVVGIEPPSRLAVAPKPTQVSALRIETLAVQASEAHNTHDYVAIEEPLEIRLVYGPMAARTTKSVYVTMRTPGDDVELAAGFLYAERILSRPDEIRELQPCGSVQGAGGGPNIIRVELQPEVTVELNHLERHFHATSSCGICGKATIEALQPVAPVGVNPQSLMVPVDVVHRLPAALRLAQATFDRTGGLHAAGLFDETGRLLSIREDVGRHNAVDKLIGAEFLAGQFPLSQRIICVSGRASFELMQKTLAAGIPILAAVGAPSHLAVELAQRFGLTLLGFVRENRFNIYAGAERIRF